jgi:hypothetical protein
MTSPNLRYPVRSRVKSPSFGTLPRQRRAALAVAQLSSTHAPAQVATGLRTLRTGACIGAAVVGGLGLAAGSVVLAVSWLLAVEAHAGELLGAAEWAASVTMIGVVAGGIAGGVVGAALSLAARVVRRAR